MMARKGGLGRGVGGGCRESWRVQRNLEENSKMALMF